MCPQLASLDQTELDVIVIGAVGCASARQPAGRSFRTLLVDRGGIGAGSRPGPADALFRARLSAETTIARRLLTQSCAPALVMEFCSVQVRPESQ